MNMKVQTLAVLLLATACGGAYATTGVTTSGTEMTVCVEMGETLAMPTVGASITKVVKTGGGEAQFTPAGRYAERTSRELRQIVTGYRRPRRDAQTYWMGHERTMDAGYDLDHWRGQGSDRRKWRWWSRRARPYFQVLSRWNALPVQGFDLDG